MLRAQSIWSPSCPPHPRVRAHASQHSREPANLASQIASCCLAAILVFSAPASQAAELLDVGLVPQLSAYAAEAKRHRHKPSQQHRSQLPSPEQSEAMLQYDKDLFTEDGWQGMQRCTSRPALLFCFPANFVHAAKNSGPAGS